MTPTKPTHLDNPPKHPHTHEKSRLDRTKTQKNTPTTPHTPHSREGALLYGAVGAVHLAIKDAGKNAGCVHTYMCMCRLQARTRGAFYMYMIYGMTDTPAHTHARTHMHACITIIPTTTNPITCC